MKPGIMTVAALVGGLSLSCAGSAPEEDDTINLETAVTVDLGEISYLFESPEPRTLVFTPLLVLDPGVKRIFQLEKEVELRKDFLRGIVLEAASQEPPESFDHPRAARNFALVLRDRLNEWLGPMENGHRVLYGVVLKGFQVSGD